MFHKRKYILHTESESDIKQLHFSNAKVLVLVSVSLVVLGSFLLIIGLPSIFAFTKSPLITFIAAMIIMGCLSTNVLIHLITLPVEFDASFKRALPILQKYVPKENMKQCRSVLRAAAFTYLAQSIVSIFRLKVILFSFINIFKSMIRR